MRPIFIQQRDFADCGVACLLSVIRMHGGDSTFEHLRIQSGTSILGTSFLGLKQAAESLNIEADVFEVDDLEGFRKGATFPCILHVINEANLEHYVVCYGHSFSPDSNSVSYSIIDPALGLKEWTEEKLLENWRSRKVLCLSPTDKFKKRKFNNKQQWNWFSQLIKEDIPLLLIAMGVGILLSLFGLATAVFNQKLIDEILPEKDIKRLWTGMSFLLIILILRSGLNYLRTLLLLRYAKSFNVRLLYSFYRKLFHLPKLFFDTRKVGEIIARLNDTRRIQGLINYLTAQAAIDILVFSMSVMFIMYYSWEMGLVALSVIPVFGLIIFKYQRKISNSQRDVMSGYAASESHFIDVIGLIEPIKLTNKENFFSQIGKSIYGSFQERLYKLGMLSNTYNWWNEFTNAIFTVTALLLMSLMVLSTQLKLGELIAIFTLMTTILAAISRIAMMNFQLQEAFVAFNRMYEFAQIEPEKTDINDDVSTLDEIKNIQVYNLSFRFPGSGILLNKVNLNLTRGELTVLLGEVGSGKSVLLQLLQKFRSYESGQVIVNNAYQLPDIEVTSWRKKMGVVPQTIRLFSGTIIENIVLDKITNEEQSRFISFCSKFGFGQFINGFPQSHLTFVGEDGCNLSGGQRQIIALMRALYNDPDVLLLDEPTSAMDSKTELFVLHLLKKLKSEKIIFMVTHGRSYAEFADVVVHLENGEVTSRVSTL
jgi:ATP-binding cassette subfamily B protein